MRGSLFKIGVALHVTVEVEENNQLPAPSSIFNTSSTPLAALVGV